ncbi:hypothetical protein C8R43DRAFT_1235896 [Mycena crocata]|nr:hypothetical protein C8R43DRAFT_1143763 [Mycena crocata]KAJ7151893.1 hypothetical protein C8R43DRAFT_1235896 [Mycena crocata]
MFLTLNPSGKLAGAITLQHPCHPTRLQRDAPNSSISNTSRNTEPIQSLATDTRLSRLEGEIAEFKHNVCAILTGSKRSRPAELLPNAAAAAASCRMVLLPKTPILRSSLMATIPEREELAHRVAEDIQQSLRQSQHRLLSERTPVAPHPPETKKVEKVETVALTCARTYHVTEMYALLQST